jgi:hypothetical protein
MLRYSLTLLDTNRAARVRVAHFTQFRDGRLFSMRALIDGYELAGQAAFPRQAGAAAYLA